MRVGKPRMREIFDDLSVHARSQADTVFNALPNNFPEPLIGSVRSAIEQRTAILAGTKDHATD
uniref:HipA N-terminal domain protein n=1 Tax=Aureimonas frigidaquae TaxID=424757 RepID=A0A0P0Z117_9HYPH|nr:HipA N-terminal domain protein [Aureimonas frigidaquae]